MPTINWGDLLKSQADDETIEQAIARIIQAHDDDESSHLDTGQALQSHKASDIIDHLAHSIIEDKIATGEISSRCITTDQIIGKDFRTAEDVGATVDGVKVGPTGIEMWQGADKKVDIPVTGNPTFKGNLDVASLSFSRLCLMSIFESLDGWYQDVGGGEANARIGGVELITSANAFDPVIIAIQPAGGLATTYTKNPLMQCYAKLESTINQQACLTIGEGDSDTARYFGFKVVNNNLYAVNRNGGTETSTQITGVVLGQHHNYKAIMVSATNIKFYVDNVLRATHTTNLPASTTSFMNYYSITSTVGGSRTLWVANSLFVQDY